MRLTAEMTSVSEKKHPLPGRAKADVIPIENNLHREESGMNQPDESFKKMLDASLKQHPMAARGQIVTGIVVDVGEDTAIIDVGAKDEGVVPLSEFEQLGESAPAVGDRIEVLVQSLGGKNGASLSFLAARRRCQWRMVEASLADGDILTATVDSEVKGGLRVDLGGLSAFMPRSEVDINPRSASAKLIGQQVEVIVLEANHRHENIVVSRRRPLEKLRDERRAAFFATTSIGDKVRGEVKRLTDFGAFVDIGGVDALLHVSDIAWRRLKHPGEALQVGQMITAEVVKLDEESGKVSLSTRSLQVDPWEHVADKYLPGMRLTGTVRNLLDYGAMVELEPGVEGMIHRSEMSWMHNNAKPSELLAEGDVVDVAVLDVDTEKRRIALSLKEVSENPWQAWLAKHPAGSHVTGSVRKITDFGLFIRLDTGLDGLAHIGNLSWHKKGEEAISSYAKGDEVQCVVLGVDIDRQRIALGIKQLENDPFEVFLDGINRGGKVEGKIVSIAPGGATVEVLEGVTARLPLREVPRGYEELKVGLAVEAKVVEVDRKRRRVGLSIRQLLRDEEKDAVRNYSGAGIRKDAPSALALELQRKILNKSRKK